MAGDGSLATMTRWLRENGYRTRRAGIRANVGCSEDYLQRLEQRLEELAEQTGQRVAIIGQSRGGIFARVLGVRRPDLVSGVVTLGSPTVNQLRAHPFVLAQIFLVGTLGTQPHPGHVPHELPARRVLSATSAPTSSPTSRPRSATRRCTRAPTASSTGAPAWTPRPSRSRSAPRTWGWG